MNKVKLVGLSLSSCIYDILKGKVAIESVVKIITGTRIACGSDLDKVIDQYVDTYWSGHNKQLCLELVEYFLFRGMIEQPRLTNGCVYTDKLGGTNWLDYNDGKYEIGDPYDVSYRHRDLNDKTSLDIINKKIEYNKYLNDNS